MPRDSAPPTARERLTGQLTGFVVSQAVYVAAAEVTLARAAVR